MANEKYVKRYRKDCMADNDEIVRFNATKISLFLYPSLYSTNSIEILLESMAVHLSHKVLGDWKP